MRPHLASSPPAALASSAAALRLHGRYPRPPGVVWKCYHLPDWRLLPRQQQRRLRSPETRSQSDADQLRRQSLQCSWTSSLAVSVDGPQTAWLVIQPFQTVAEDIFIWSVGPKRSVNFLLTALIKILLLTYLEKCKTSLSIVSTCTFRYWTSDTVRTQHQHEACMYRVIQIYMVHSCILHQSLTTTLLLRVTVIMEASRFTLVNI